MILSEYSLFSVVLTVMTVLSYQCYETRVWHQHRDVTVQQVITALHLKALGREHLLLHMNYLHLAVGKVPCRHVEPPCIVPILELTSLWTINHVIYIWSYAWSHEGNMLTYYCIIKYFHFSLVLNLNTCKNTTQNRKWSAFYLRKNFIHMTSYPLIFFGTYVQ